MSLTDVRALLSGRGAPMDPARGAALAEEAARAGDADAAVLSSTVAGAGFGRPQNWSDALEWLVRAAELGHAEALAQLLLLAGAQDGEPRALQRAVDLASWTRARPSRVVANRPRIGVSQRFLEPEACAWIIRRSAPLQAPARVYNPVTGQAMQHDVRSNTLAMLTILELDLLTLLVRQRIANTFGVPVLNLERASVFRYLPGQRFNPHCDFLDPKVPQFARELATLGQRAATFLVYLNEAFQGGETHFLLAHAKFKGNTGDAVFFHNVGPDGAPDPLTLHEGAPPSSGEKWLLSQFIRDRAQLPG